jgi:hypothetical protein
VPRLREFYPGICLTNEEKAQKNLSQGKKNLSQSTVYTLPKHPHIIKPKPTHTHTYTLQNPHIHTHTPTHARSWPAASTLKPEYYNSEQCDVWCSSKANPTREINKIVYTEMDVLRRSGRKINDGKNKK